MAGKGSNQASWGNSGFPGQLRDPIYDDHIRVSCAMTYIYIVGNIDLPNRSIEPICRATIIRTTNDIIQHGRILVEGVVEEPDGTLSSLQPFLVDPIHDRRHDRGTRAGARGGLKISVHVDVDVVSDRRNVRVASTFAVVDSAAGAEGVVVHALVICVRGRVFGEVVAHGLGLVIGRVEEVAEASSRVEFVGFVGGGYFGGGVGIV